MYGSSSSSQESKKKNLNPLSILDREMINNWAKDVFAYFAAPFMVPSAISNAITNVPSGLEVETFWGKIARSLRSALLKRSSEGRDTSNSGSDDENSSSDNSILAALIKKRVIPATAHIAESLSKRINSITTILSDAYAAQKKIESEEGKEEEGSEDALRKKRKSIDYGPLGSRGESNKFVQFIDFFRVKKHRQDPPAIVKKS